MTTPPDVTARPTSSVSSRSAAARCPSPAEPNQRAARASSPGSTAPPGNATYPGRNRLSSLRCTTRTSGSPDRPSRTQIADAASRIARASTASILPAGEPRHTAMMGDAATPMEAIRVAIEGRGPITFAEFMELALYGRGGFYATPPIGPRGDFVTSPHVHPVFGELVAAALRELHDGLGRPTPLRVAEMGAGDGTLARGLLDAAGDLPIAYTAIERSPGARTALSTIEGIEVRAELAPPVDAVLGNE